jgi:hypothetical protein
MVMHSRYASDSVNLASLPFHYRERGEWLQTAKRPTTEVSASEQSDPQLS